MLFSGSRRSSSGSPAGVPAGTLFSALLARGGHATPRSGLWLRASHMQSRTRAEAEAEKAIETERETFPDDADGDGRPRPRARQH